MHTKYSHIDTQTDYRPILCINVLIKFPTDNLIDSSDFVITNVPSLQFDSPDQ